MAAKPKKSITNLPLPIKVKDVEENFIKVTERNKSMLLVHGRILYVIKPVDIKNMVIQGWFELRPRLTKGWLDLAAEKVVETQSYFIFEDEHIDDYKSLGAHILRHLEQDRLYIKRNELITKYSKRI